MPETPESHPTTTDEKLDQVIYHLERLDRRDRMRTWGALVHTLLSLIPTIILLITVWYVYANASKLLTNVASEAAKQASVYSQSNLTKQFQQYFQK